MASWLEIVVVLHLFSPNALIVQAKYRLRPISPRISHSYGGLVTRVETQLNICSASSHLMRDRLTVVQRVWQQRLPHNVLSGSWKGQ